MSSCDDPALRDALKLLNLLPSSPRVMHERALHDLTMLLESLRLDFVPVQLRMLGAAETARRILQACPRAYAESEGRAVESFFRDQDRLEQDTDYSYETPDRRGLKKKKREKAVGSEFLVKRASLRDRPPPGARLVRVLSAVYGSQPEVLLEIRVALVQAAVSLGDLEGAYRLSLALLSSSLDGVGRALHDAVVEAVTIVLGMLDADEEKEQKTAGGGGGESVEEAKAGGLKLSIRRALRQDLFSQLLASCSQESLLEIEALLAQAGASQLRSISSADDISGVLGEAEVALGGMISGDAFAFAESSQQQQSVDAAAPSEPPLSDAADDRYVEAAREVLLAVIADLLSRPGDASQLGLLLPDTRYLAD